MKTLMLHGQPVATENYERLKRLYFVAYWMTDAGIPKRKAEKAAMNAAVDALNAIAKRLYFDKARTS